MHIPLKSVLRKGMQFVLFTFLEKGLCSKFWTSKVTEHAAHAAQELDVPTIPYIVILACWLRQLLDKQRLMVVSQLTVQ